MRRLTRTFAAATLATALVLVSACGGGDDADKGSDGGQSLEKVTYLTSFGNFGRDAYVWVAKEKGFFKEAGFDVEVQEGKGSVYNMQQLQSGNVQFMPGDLSGFLMNLDSGEGEGAVAVAAIQQRTLSAIMTLDNKQITTAKDLEGKTIADTPSSLNRLLFPTYARMAGVDASKVKWVNGEPATLMQMLVSGNVDAIGQFVVGTPTLEAQAKGPKAVVLSYSDVMADLYGNVLITTTKLVEERPDMVRKFAEALIKGLEYAVNNPAEAGEILKKNVPAANAESAAAELELMAPYVTAAGADKIGVLDVDRVARTIALLQSAGAISDGLTPDKVVNLNVSPKA